MHQWLMKRTLVEQVITAIADAKDVEADNLEITLENYIRTEAIRELESHSSSSWHLEFEAGNHVVTITESNEILVDGKRKHTPSTSS